MSSSDYTFIDREVSWLSFSERVLQEAADTNVPPLERLLFCAIFSSNLDEWFRVRVASLRQLLRLGEADTKKLGFNPPRLLHELQRTVFNQQEEYGRILRGEVLPLLESHGIFLVDEDSLSPAQGEFLSEYFRTEVQPHLGPVILESDPGTPALDDGGLHLVVALWPQDDSTSHAAPRYALVRVPSPPVGRFVVLPSDDSRNEVMFLDDVVRYNLPVLFPDSDVGDSFAVKLTRDADLHLEDEDELGVTLVEAIRKSLKKRETGVPSRFLYDQEASRDILTRMKEWLVLSDHDFIAGGRYHNLSDFFGFPRFGRADLCYPEWPPIPHPELEGATSVMALMREKDRVVHFPYQSFDHVIDFLDEAAGDPDVEELWLTVYRVARDSAVLTALLKAAEAGKRVNVFMEVQARFDEATNLEWADRMEAAGVNTLYSMEGLKVHAKLALVRRREGDGHRLYGYLGTGNFNEKTSKLYADHGVLTADERLTRDVEQVFKFLAGEVDQPVTEHLLVAPTTLRSGFSDLIKAEIKAARAGEPSGITLKMNSLQDTKMIKKLYRASNAGVPIQLIVRGIFRLAVGVPGQSESITARSILDRYLEHARIYIFHAGGEEKMYLASADWMKRNLSRRVEVAFPIYDPDVRAELQRLVDIQLADNQKARILNAKLDNPRVPAEAGAEPVRSQEAFREWLENR
jgi:polyphosphate kinase